MNLTQEGQLPLNFSPSTKPTRKDVARRLLDEFGYVTNRMFNEAGWLHVGRNACSELKTEYLDRGYTIHFVRGESFMENRWELRRVRA